VQRVYNEARTFCRVDLLAGRHREIFSRRIASGVFNIPLSIVIVSEEQSLGLDCEHFKRSTTMKLPAKIPAPFAYQESKRELELDEEQVRCRAYELYEKRGRENGHDVDDWMEAKSEIARKEGKAAA
jgi:hypothetical protein